MNTTDLAVSLYDNNDDLAVSDATTNAATENPAIQDQVATGVKALLKAVKRIDASAQAVADQRALVAQLRDDITRALDAGGDGFDAAGRAYKSANNKLDRLMDSNAAAIGFAKDGIEAVRKLLDQLEADLAAKEEAQA